MNVATSNLMLNSTLRATNNRKHLAEVDWRASGCVLPALSQGSCASCYAFATLANIETMKCLLTKTKPRRLATQQLVDCFDGDGKLFGCGGGNLNRILPYIKSKAVIAYEECYPYKANRSECSLEKLIVEKPECLTTPSTNGDPLSYKLIESEDLMIEHLSTVGPLIGFFVPPLNFEGYSGGILTKELCKDIDSEKEVPFGHFIEIVGFGTESGRDFWIFKNSWGTNWGFDGGFGKIERGNNACSIEWFAFAILN